MKGHHSIIFNPTGDMVFLGGWGGGLLYCGCFSFYVRGFVRTSVAPVLSGLSCHTPLQPIGCRRCPAAGGEKLLEPQDFPSKLHEHFNVL